ncbi:MAG TPA: sulfotransferase [Chloroflexota bacterium]
MIEKASEYMRKASSAGLASDTRSPIFIGGHHRSGTTLMRVMLHRHPHIACGPESQLLDRTSFLEFHRYLEETWVPQFEQYGFGADEMDRAVAAFVDNVFTRYQLQRGKRRWAEKTPKNILRIDYLFRLFPQAQFIHMVRDPRDVHCSVRRKASTETPRWSKFTADETARSWVKRIRRGLAWRDDPRYLEVRYEDLVYDPEATMRTVLMFLREPWDDCILGSNDTAVIVPAQSNANRQVFTTSVERWQRDLPVEDVEQIETIAGPMMRCVGYEPSRVQEDSTMGVASTASREG